MKKTITHISSKETAFTLAVITSPLLILVIAVSFLMSLLSGHILSAIGMLIMGVFYLGAMFVIGYVYCWFYNLAIRNKWCKGFVFTLEDEAPKV